MKSADEIRARLCGPCSSIPTIFTRAGEMDLNGVRAVIDATIANDGDIIMLTWGDSLISLLTDQEVAELHRAVREQAGDRAVTIACDNMWGLNKCVEFARFVRDLGFDLYMIRPAEWARGTPEALADFYRAVARETRIMFVGDVPIRTCELLEDQPDILAFKEDLTLEYAHEVLVRWGDRWPMIGGGGMKRHHVLWPQGNCDSWLDAWVRCYPAPSRSYWEALQQGDARAAWEIALRFDTPLRDFARSASYGADGVSKHALLEVYGVAPRWRRSPAANPTDAEMEQLRDFLRGQGLLPVTA